MDTFLYNLEAQTQGTWTWPHGWGPLKPFGYGFRLVQDPIWIGHVATLFPTSSGPPQWQSSHLCLLIHSALLYVAHQLTTRPGWSWILSQTFSTPPYLLPLASPALSCSTPLLFCSNNRKSHRGENGWRGGDEGKRAQGGDGVGMGSGNREKRWVRKGSDVSFAFFNQNRSRQLGLSRLSLFHFLVYLAIFLWSLKSTCCSI